MYIIVGIIDFNYSIWNVTHNDVIIVVSICEADNWGYRRKALYLEGDTIGICDWNFEGKLVVIKD